MSIQRVLKPEIVDTFEEASRYDALDHSEEVCRFVDDLLALDNVRGDILDLGTGTALIPIEICRRLEDCRIMAVDLSTYMLDLGRLNIEIAGLIQRIMLDHVDMRRLPHQDQYFDIVLSNNVLHYAADPSGVLRDATRVLRPGGLLFFRDFLRPDSEEAVSQLAAERAPQASDAQRGMLADSLRAGLQLHEIRELVRQLGFDAQTVQATEPWQWTWIARRPGSPLP